MLGSADGHSMDMVGCRGNVRVRVYYISSAFFITSNDSDMLKLCSTSKGSKAQRYVTRIDTRLAADGVSLKEFRPHKFLESYNPGDISWEITTNERDHYVYHV